MITVVIVTVILTLSECIYNDFCCPTLIRVMTDLILSHGKTSPFVAMGGPASSWSSSCHQVMRSSSYDQFQPIDAHNPPEHHPPLQDDNNKKV